MNFSPLRFTKSLFVTAFLILALSASSFARPKKTVETEAQKTARLAKAAKKAAATQQHERDATADTDPAAGASSSSAEERGTQSSAVYPSSKQSGGTRTSKIKRSLSADTLRLLSEGLAGSTTAEQAVSKAQKVRQTSTGVATPPGITMSNLPQAKAASAAIEAATSSHEQQEVKTSSESHPEDASIMVGIAGPLDGSQTPHAFASLNADSKEAIVSSSAAVEKSLSESLCFGQNLKQTKHD